MDPNAPHFVVGTGRCGSTMISTFLRAHRHVLSLSEFWCFVTDLGGRIAETFAPEPVDAAQFWALVSGAPPKQSTMRRHGVAMPEMLYRGSRYGTDVPALMQTTLPHLSDEPEALLGEIETFVAGLPPAAMADHCLRLFMWLRARLGKRMWVERSGGSLRIVRRLIEAFPNARFVHLVRDGRDCALSMSRHHGFRMALVAMQLTEILGVDPFESSDRSFVDDVPDELARFLPEDFDAEAFRRYATPVPLCGHYWSGEIMAGVRELAALPSDRVLTMRYEDFLARPEASITRLASFLGPDMVDEAWVRAIAATVRPSERSSILEPAERRALDDACRPGFAALGDLYAEQIR
jgi:hypothetical protein